MTELVQQRTPHDCSVCCLAMFSGRPYETVIELAGEDFDPVKGMWSVQGTLQRLGLSSEYKTGDFCEMRRQYAISTDFFRDMAWWRRALLSVPSLNNPGGLHMVYYDGHALFDPSTRQRYDNFEQLRPDEIVVFREVVGRAEAA